MNMMKPKKRYFVGTVFDPEAKSSRVWGFFLNDRETRIVPNKKKLGWLDGSLSFSTPKTKIHSSMSDGAANSTERRSRR